MPKLTMTKKTGVATGESLNNKPVAFYYEVSGLPPGHRIQIWPDSSRLHPWEVRRWIDGSPTTTVDGPTYDSPEEALEALQNEFAE